MADPANPNAQPTSLPTNKTFAATGGSAVGAAIATIVLYLIDPESKIPDAVRGAIAVLITAVVTFIAGYFIPHGASEGIVRTAAGNVAAAR